MLLIETYLFNPYASSHNRMPASPFPAPNDLRRVLNVLIKT